jgi:hypothetical protein
MMHLDLSSVLNLISTVAIVGALVFTALQVRQANLKRSDQAAVTLVQTTQSERWTYALDLIRKLPENAQLSDIERTSPEMERCLFDFGVRLETAGYMVFRRILKLDMVDDLIGGVTLVFWSRAKAWAEHIRIQTGNPKYFEWCEWLAGRITERRVKLGNEPAHIRHAAWRE